MKNEIIEIFANGIVLTIPVIVWNLAFAGCLPPEFQPDIFWDNIPAAVRYGENIFRVLLFSLPLLMTLNLKRRNQRTGLIVYLVGLVVYFASWIPLLFFPGLSWSSSMIGFLAPAITPILWTAGIGMMGDRLYFSIPYHYSVYLKISALFVMFHGWHVLTVFQRIH